jgi:ribosomal protein S21
VQVLVRDNNVDQALKALKKKMQREGIFREMKLRGHYEKPSEKKAREKAEAARRPAADEAEAGVRRRSGRRAWWPQRRPGRSRCRSPRAALSRLFPDLSLITRALRSALLF